MTTRDPRASTKTAIRLAVLTGPGADIIACYPESVVTLNDVELTVSGDRVKLSTRWTVKHPDGTHSVVREEPEGWYVATYDGGREIHMGCGDTIVEASALPLVLA